MGQLVTDSKFPVSSPYSSRGRSTGPEGSLPLCGKKPWTKLNRDLNVVWEARGTRAPGYRPLADPSHSTPHSWWPEAAVEPTSGSAFELLGHDGL
jgi:hypothetical protein